MITLLIGLIIVLVIALILVSYFMFQFKLGQDYYYNKYQDEQKFAYGLENDLRLAKMSVMKLKEEIQRNNANL